MDTSDWLDILERDTAALRERGHAIQVDTVFAVTAIATTLGTMIGQLRRRGLLDEETEATFWAKLRQEQAESAPIARPQFGRVIDHLAAASGIVPDLPSWAVH